MFGTANTEDSPDRFFENAGMKDNYTRSLLYTYSRGGILKTLNHLMSFEECLQELVYTEYSARQ